MLATGPPKSSGPMAYMETNPNHTTPFMVFTCHTHYVVGNA
jgi:hypothetical protein